MGLEGPAHPAWSAPAWWEMGLLAPSDWTAQWIEPDLPEDPSMPQPSPMLRRAFALKRAVRSARIYVTSHGLYELSINGKRVGEDVLTPGWTSYATRLQYQTYDVTQPACAAATTSLGALLGNGWYRGQIGFQKHRNHYGDRLALLAQLDVTYADGTRETIGSDAQWKAATGPIQLAEIYGGETYDARLEKAGLGRARIRRHQLEGVRVAEHPKDNAHRAGWSAGAPHRRSDADQDPHVPIRSDDRRHGAEHGGLGAAHGRRGPRARP